ncbi:hypothetical protein RCO27_17555 [Sphingosinicella sp. LHD-64]|uniref:hypothetical protein n=1 Tax=Sphingosinicella sp. LHD-64 TaxID=3072139 RepID=UPI00280DC26B|nr:hypothetical protein [Sphingosinicella sp. LHD-64]MDQ8758036.1 hypothetical protein [Sphingosinicella sp. LHD-64]
MRAALMITGIGLLALAACNSGAPETGNAAASSAANAAEPVNAVAASDGSAVLDIVPAYPNAEQVQSGGAAGGRGGFMAFRTADPPVEVADFYARAAEQAGFTIEDRTNLNRMTVGMTARRGASDMITVSATRVGNVTQVQLMASAAGR